MNPKGNKTAVEPIYNKADVKAIGESLKEEDTIRGQPAYLIWLLCISQGMRVGDALKLRVASVCGHGKQIRDYIEYREEKTEKTQKRKLADDVRGPLKEYVDGLDWSRTKYQSYLFESCRKQGRPYTYKWINSRIKEAAAVCSVDQAVTTHSMRKTFAYNFYMKYKDDKTKFASPDECLRYLSRHVLKHASEDITRRYLGIEYDQDKLDDLLNGVAEDLI